MNITWEICHHFNFCKSMSPDDNIHRYYNTDYYG
jgi:hypothetical protein